MNDNICFIDFETTGVDVFKDNPIELGAVLVNSKGTIIKKFHCFIKPRTQRRMSKSAKQIHGLSFGDLLSKKNQNDVIKEFFNLMGTNYRFGGWNINFDVSFFRSMCHHTNMMSSFNKINHRHIDVQTINFTAQRLGLIDNKINSLTDLSYYFGLSRKFKHSAIEDAEIAAEIYYKLLNHFKLSITQR